MIILTYTKSKNFRSLNIYFCEYLQHLVLNWSKQNSDITNTRLGYNLHLKTIREQNSVEPSLEISIWTVC